jgi:acyl carrier protein
MSDPLIELFAQGLGLEVDSLSDLTSPDNTAEWDSLAAMEMVTLIEDNLDVSLSTRDIMKMRSIGMAREVLRAKGVEGV